MNCNKDFNQELKDNDREIYEILLKEQIRQEEHLELIASENYTSKAVMAMQGSILTNKYAEGYPGKRYYGGCENVDLAEKLAIDRLKKLYKCNFANVQPHSGSQANFSAYAALINPGDKILGMSLNHGGHLTHGSTVNFSGKLYNSSFYGIDTESGLIDFNIVEGMAKQIKPQLIIAGFSAYSRKIDWQKFREIADMVGAYLLVDMAHISGLVATNLYPSPVQIADIVTSTTHKTLRGPRGGFILTNNEDLYKKINSSVFPGSQGGPLMHVIAAKAVAFKEALSSDFLKYQQQVVINAQTMAEVFISRDYNIVSNGTDNHLILVDLTNKNISGKDAEKILEEANITVNKNTVPNETRSPFITSGIRIGTPAITTRGMQENEMKIISHWICDLLDNKKSVNEINIIKDKVISLCNKFSVYKKYYD